MVRTGMVLGTVIEASMGASPVFGTVLGTGVGISAVLRTIGPLETPVGQEREVEA